VVFKDRGQIKNAGQECVFAADHLISAFVKSPAARATTAGIQLSFILRSRLGEVHIRVKAPRQSGRLKGEQARGRTSASCDDGKIFPNKEMP
jgi:hypothetical protein